MQQKNQSNAQSPFLMMAHYGSFCAVLLASYLTGGGMPVSTVEPVTVKSHSTPISNTTVSFMGYNTLPVLEYYPTDTLFTCLQREQYQAGDLSLEIPRLSLNLSVQNGAEIESGAGLYEVSPLPGTGNANVSIACGADAKLEALQQNDCVYLTYQGWCYTYLFARIERVKDDDWLPIYCTDSSQITLIAGTDTEDERMCLTGTLISVEAVE